MKKVLIISFSLSLLFSCKEAEKAEPVTETPVVTAPVEPAVNYPFSATLASDLKMGNPQNTVKVMEMYKILEAGVSVDSLLLPYLADSVTSVAFDQRRFHGSGKDFADRVKKFRLQFKSLNEEIITFAAFRSDASDLDFVSIWFKEKAVWNNGKSDSTFYQENWRFNKEGKIYYRTAFARYSF
jgi:hypothetical protein